MTALGIRIAIAGAALALFAGAWYAADSRGYDRAVADRLALDNIAAAAARVLEQAAIETQTREQAARLAINVDQENVIAGLQRRLRSGADVLRIPTACPAPEVTATGGGPVSETGSTVMPQTAADILGIAGDIAKNVRERNALIDAYTAAKMLCNEL